MNTVIKLLKSHTSIRNFKEYPVSDDTVIELIEAGQSAASSNFVQAYTVIQVKDPEKRRIMAEIAGNQKHVETSPVFLVFVADLQRARLCSTLHGESMEEGQAEAFIIATVDTALMAQNLMIAAESMGLGGVYIGALRNNPRIVSELLELPEHTYPLFGMCLGYPASINEKKPRLPATLILKTDTYQNGAEVQLLEKYDQTISEYYSKRSSLNRSDNYTQQMARMFSKPLRPHMKAYLSEQKLNTK